MPPKSVFYGVCPEVSKAAIIFTKLCPQRPKYQSTLQKCSLPSDSPRQNIRSSASGVVQPEGKDVLFLAIGKSQVPSR